MEQYRLSTTIDPIEVAFLRGGRRRVMAVAAVRAVEDGALAMVPAGLAVVDRTRADDPFARALIAVLDRRQLPLGPRRLLAHALFDARAEARRLERRLIAEGLVREPSVLRPFLGRCTPEGRRTIHMLRLTFPAVQITAINPPLALALYGPRALAGTRYARRPGRSRTAPTAQAGCGFGFIGCGSGCGGGCAAGCGGGSGCGSGGCGGSA